MREISASNTSLHVEVELRVNLGVCTKDVEISTYDCQVYGKGLSL